MEETDSDGGCEACPAGFNGGERASYLEDMLRRFVHSVFGYLCAEATGAGEDFRYPGGTHAS